MVRIRRPWTMPTDAKRIYERKQINGKQQFVAIGWYDRWGNKILLDNLGQGLLLEVIE